MIDTRFVSEKGLPKCHCRCCTLEEDQQPVARGGAGVGVDRDRDQRPVQADVPTIAAILIIVVGVINMLRLLPQDDEKDGDKPTPDETVGDKPTAAGQSA